MVRNDLVRHGGCSDFARLRVGRGTNVLDALAWSALC